MGMIADNGNCYYSNEDSRIYVNDLAYEMGFRTGDRILKFDDYVPEDFTMLQADLARRSVKTATVLRDKDTVLLYIDRSMIGEVLNSPRMFSLAVPFQVDSLAEGSVNAALRHGDRVIAIDSTKVSYVQDAWEALKVNAGKDVTACVVRGADTLDVPVKVDTAGRIGVVLQIPGLQKRTYTFAQAIPAGIKYTWNMVAGYTRDIKLVATRSFSVAIPSADAPPRTPYTTIFSSKGLIPCVTAVSWRLSPRRGY